MRDADHMGAVDIYGTDLVLEKMCFSITPKNLG